jgi:hypothetical protein
MIMFGPLLLQSGEYIPSGDDALKLTLETHIPGFVEMCEGDAAPRPRTKDWALARRVVLQDRMRFVALMPINHQRRMVFSHLSFKRA